MIPILAWDTSESAWKKSVFNTVKASSTLKLNNASQAQQCNSDDCQLASDDWFPSCILHIYALHYINHELTHSLQLTA